MYSNKKKCNSIKIIKYFYFVYFVLAEEKCLMRKVLCSFRRVGSLEVSVFISCSESYSKPGHL